MRSVSASLCTVGDANYSPHLESLYGGAAGGGKSDALLMGALQDVHIRGYSAVIFRKSYRDLFEADAIADRAMKWAAVWKDMGLPVKFHGEDIALHFADTGARIAFRHLQHEGSKYNYQGVAFQYPAAHTSAHLL